MGGSRNSIGGLLKSLNGLPSRGFSGGVRTSRQGSDLYSGEGASGRSEEMVKSMTFSIFIGCLISLATRGVLVNGSGMDLADDKIDEGPGGPRCRPRVPRLSESEVKCE